MKSWLTLGLVAVVGATVALSMQEEVEVDAPARVVQDGGQSGATDEGHRSKRGDLPARTATPVAPASEHQQHMLVQAVQAWQQRAQHLSGQTGVRRLPEAMAWAAQLPPPPPPPPPVAVLATPAPPVFPHAWIGSYIDEAPRAILAGSARTWVVRAGDVIEGQWRIDAIGDRQMQVTYLPMQQRITLMMK